VENTWVQAAGGVKKQETGDRIFKQSVFSCQRSGKFRSQKTGDRKNAISAFQVKGQRKNIQLSVVRDFRGSWFVVRGSGRSVE